VATAALELGIDIGAVDLVCQIGSPRSLSSLLQRVGRAGHFLGGISRGRLFPLSRDELVECTAHLEAIRRGELDRLRFPEAPLDILAQQLVATTAADEWGEDELFELVRGAWPYRALDRQTFDQVLAMLTEGFSGRMGRRARWLHHDGVGRRVRARRGARMVAITSGGAIPDTADYRVVAEPDETFVGTVNQDFAIESSAGDIFQLGNTSWRIRRVLPGQVRVEDARGAPPTIPFWLGEAPSRTTEVSAAVSRIRRGVAARLDEPAAAVSWLAEVAGLGTAAATQIVDYLGSARAALGVVPNDEALVLERFFDEAGGMQLVLHTPFGGRINRAWGLALRKRFCRQFNFELQAAATEDGIVLSLGPQHSFPLDDVWRYLRTGSARHVLEQAILPAPMFEARWRWNTTRSLAIPRMRRGKKVPPPLQRMIAADLLAAVFPDQAACAENLVGEPVVPDHPLVRQTCSATDEKSN
jgi:ATP-dependent Lhr-like helicase